MTKKCEFERLPKSVIPKHYILSLKPDLVKLTFDGTVAIDVEIHEPTDKIILNASELTISKAVYEDESKKEHVSKSINVLEEEQTALLLFENLPKGKGQLRLEFQGILNDKLRGFYRCKYTVDGEERNAAATQFEATDARRAFPCWDEPAVKATFDVTLTVPKDRLALSNMNVISDKEIDSNLREVKFATSPIMSTYLLAFIVGEYDFVEGKTSEGLLVRVYTPLGKKEQGKTSLEVTIKSLNFYENYFNIKYPLPKLDLIALADFASGAMENWGLITYRETALLIDPENSSVGSVQAVSSTVAHELAHQWFGNLVTMEWWTHLWLNEGFAVFMDYLCLDDLHPEYEVFSQFVNDHFYQSLNLDALDSSHPIEVPVNNPSEVREIFDAISYCKGASVIRMLHGYLSDEVFRKGVSLYLNKHKFGNTQTEDLWQALEQSSGKPIGSMMSTWTKQKGFPLVKVSSKQDGNDRIVSLSQEKFSSSQTSDESLWKIPISFITTSSPNKSVKDILFETKTTEVRLENVKANDWIKLNLNAVGFYRVKYSNNMLLQLLPAISNRSIGHLDRLSLQSDLFALVQLGQAPTTEYLQLIESFVDETDYSIWNSIHNNTRTLRLVISNKPNLISPFHAYCRKIFSNIYAKLGWEAHPEESHLDKLLRNVVLICLVSARDEPTLQKAKKLFEDHVSGVKLIPGDLRASAFRGAMAACNDEESLEKIIKFYKDLDSHEEKQKISLALGYLPSQEMLRKALEFGFSEHVRTQSSYAFPIAVSLFSEERDLAWNFFKENNAIFKEKFEGTSLGPLVIKNIIENFATEEKANEIQEYFKKNPFTGVDRAIQQGIETVKLNAKWLSRDEEALESFLKRYQ